MLSLTDSLPAPFAAPAPPSPVRDLAPRPTAIPLPTPRRGGVHIRPATLADLPFIDALQKQTSKAVGFMPRAQLEGKVNRHEVLVAEGGGSEGRGTWAEAGPETRLTSSGSAVCPHPTSPAPTSPAPTSPTSPLGYLIGSDRYFKRDDVGVIYQIGVIEGERRGLVAATLLRAQFDRSAYGCRLYCCWCAQDLPANRFWEAMGFVPLAFRTGSATRGSKGSGRTHIFWQKRIRPGDETSDWWFPSTTNGGALRGDRIVLPIPPGVHWSDTMPVILPEAAEDEPAALPEPKPRRTSRKKAEPEADDSPKVVGPNFNDLGRLRLERARIEQRVRQGELPASALTEAMEAERQASAPPPSPAKKAKKPRPKPAKKADPRHVALARELRDKWLEQANAEPGLLLPRGKYDVSRQLVTRAEPISSPLLPAAA